MARQKVEIEWPSERIVKSMRPYVDRVVAALGRPEAWVSDLSRVSDFFDHDWSEDESDPEIPKANAARVARAARRLGVAVRSDDFIRVVARRVREATRRPRPAR